MKIPEFMLPDKCTIQPLDGSTPAGPTYLTTSSSKKCRVENNSKWVGGGINNKDKVQIARYTKLFVNYSSDVPNIPVDSLVTIEGDSNTYTVVDFKKIGGFTNSHWELILQ